MASAYMGSIKRTSAAGRRLASVALTLGMLLLQSRATEADCESINASIASNAEEYRREQKQSQFLSPTAVRGALLLAQT